MGNSLKKQTINGIGWSAIERFSVQGITFIIQIVLARILTPTDYGLVGMLAVFIQISQVFVDSGFANALIQKRICEDSDYSTVFYVNIGISVILYIILYSIAPYIAVFYKEPILQELTRILSIVVLLNALYIVPRTILIKKVDFKTLSYVSLASTTISGIVGIFLAYEGYSYWSLVGQQLSNALLQCIIFFILTGWKPLLVFSVQSCKGLFNFGSKLLVSNLISSTYKNLYTVTIGKCCSAIELGYFTRAEQISMFPSSNISNIIARVAFPVFSKIQNNNDLLCDAYRKMIRLSSIVIFPLMIGLIVMAKPFVIVVLSEKWINMTFILQLLCIDWMLDHLSVLNLNLLFVKGRSDLALKIEIIKKIIALVILLLTVPYGIIVMCYGRILYSVIATAINSFYTKSLIGLSLVQQLYDIRTPIFNALIMALVIIISTCNITNYYMILTTGIVVGGSVYFLATMLTNKELLTEIKRNIKNDKKNS